MKKKSILSLEFNFVMTIHRKSIELTFTTLLANVPLFPGMNDKVKCKLFLAFKRFHAHRTYEWPFRIVRLLVPCQMVLAFQCGIANVTNKSMGKLVLVI